MNQAPRSPDAIGRMFWSIDSKIDSTALSNATLSIHRYADNQYKEFGKAMPIIGMDFPESEIQRLEFLELGVRSNVDTCVQEMRQRIDPRLLTVLLNEKFDISLLINSPGGGASIARMFSHYLQNVAASGGIETIATTEAKSAAHELFSQGNSRLALPDTQFMIHRPGNKIAAEERAVQLGVSVSQINDAYTWWVENITDPNYDHVLSQIAEPQREKMALLFASESLPLTAERRIDFRGSDVPGFVTEYLDQVTPLHEQLSNRYGVPISPSNFYTDGLVRFAILSEVDHILQFGELAHMHLRVSFQDKKLRIQGTFDNQKDGDSVIRAVTEALQIISKQYGIDFSK